LHELSVAEDGGERRSQLVAHIGHELRPVLARDLKVLDRLGKFARARLHLLKQTRVLNSDHRLVGEGLNEGNLPVVESLRLPAGGADRTMTVSPRIMGAMIIELKPKLRARVRSTGGADGLSTSGAN